MSQRGGEGVGVIKLARDILMAPIRICSYQSNDDVIGVLVELSMKLFVSGEQL